MSSFTQASLDKLVIPQRIITMIRKLGEHKGRQDFIRNKHRRCWKIFARWGSDPEHRVLEPYRGIVADDKRLRAIVEEKAKPANRPEAEITGYRDVLNTIPP